MANRYIVEVFTWNSNTNVYEKKDDCVMMLDSKTGDLSIESSTTKNLLYMSFNIVNDDFSILSKERHNVSHLRYRSTLSNGVQSDQTIDYEMRYKNNRFGVRFDSRSSASATNFQTEYTKLRTKHRTVEKYQSGRIKLEGFKTNSGVTGTGIEYYDIDGSPIKYVGEFEEGVYDGEGEFYSASGDIVLHCNNICSGVPNGKGTFVVGKNKLIRVLEMKDFKDLSSKRDDYLSSIYSRIDPAYEETLELVRFESLSLEDRTIFMFKEMQKLRQILKTTNTTVKGSFFNLF
ncbi:hypothetical protein YASMINEVIRUS_683 [Yasminevirus sp. GU-2018]|uniref:MORN repeat-containing protein n=1 Tax=Yasminevirus sp. GU-2018 TaxID=2420051 RepID=A0A5K0U8T1_9VIRU|nr:hypothetical protein YASMINEVIRUS_683 [Yasminevirus sp. GU-2018]